MLVGGVVDVLEVVEVVDADVVVDAEVEGDRPVVVVVLGAGSVVLVEGAGDGEGD